MVTDSPDNSSGETSNSTDDSGTGNARRADSGESRKKKSGLDRRTVLQTSGAVAGGAALAGCLGGDDEVTAGFGGDHDSDDGNGPDIDDTTNEEDVDEWDEEREVVIVGGGGAATCAALEIVEAGGDPVILEKEGEPGGDTRMSGGWVYMGGGTTLQEELGIEDSVEELQTYLQSRHGLFMSDERIEVFAERSAEQYDWLVDHGVEFHENHVQAACCFESGVAIGGGEEIYPHREIVEPIPRSHHAIGDGPGLFDPLYESARDEGIDYVMNTEVTSLVETDDGRIVGVEATVGEENEVGEEDEENPETQYYKAERAVILATGGFQANPEMVERHIPHFSGLAPLDVPMVHDGSGIQMGTSAGAATHGLNHAFGVLFLFPPFEVLEGIMINNNGIRFVHEDSHAETIPVHIVDQEDQEAWLLVDQPIVNAVDEMEGGSLERANFEQVAMADSLEGLAEEIPPPTVTTVDTVESYNEMAAEAGEDLAFNKHERYVRELDSPPYYAYRVVNETVLFATLGGLEINADTQVLDGHDEPVEGLFGAGRVTSLSHRYDSGFALGNMITWGRIAGEQAMETDTWD